MNRTAIFHRTYSEYSFATAPDRVVIRLRAAKGDLDCCTLHYGDRMEQKSPITITSVTMQVRYSDRLFDYFEAIIDPKVTRLCYYFELVKGGEKVYYYNDDFHAEPDINRQLYYNFHYIRTEDMAEVPDWFKKAVVYQIYPDSFATKHAEITGKPREVHRAGQVFSSHNGGTLAGVRANLDYLQDLGITCIYLTPIFAANSWHKYDTVDYFKIDPCFGTKKELHTLVDDCHARGIRVILDGVFNHCGPDFFAFKDLREKGKESPYYDWFYAHKFPLKTSPKPNYECFAYVASMPKLNTGNPEVVKYFTKVGTYWLKEFGIDGWRLDVANEINHDFWRQFRHAIKKVNPEAVLIAEIWDDARSFLSGDQFDSAMNYNLTFAVLDAIAHRKTSPQDLVDRCSYLQMRYQEPIAQGQMNLIDSHDVPRFLSECGENRAMLKQGAAFLLTHVGAPTICYGDEQGLKGFSEAEYRQPMPWGKQDVDLHDFYKSLIGLRKKYQEEINGGFFFHFADAQILVYGAAVQDRGFVVAMNLSDQPLERVLPKPHQLSQLQQITGDGEFAGLVDEETRGNAYVGEDGQLHVQLPADGLAFLQSC